MTRIYFLINFIVIIGCGKKDKVVEYYDDGTLHKTYYVNNGETNGEFLEYYKNGNIKIQGYFERNRANGIFKEFSINGELLEIGNYVDDKAVGWFKYYRDGKVKMKRQYVLINDQPYINQYIIHDEFENILKDSSNYVSVEKTDVSNKYIIRLEASMFKSDYMEVLIGEFTNDFKPVNPTLIDTLNIVGKLEVAVELEENEKAIVCDILKEDSLRQIRFIYFDPSLYEY